MQSKNETAPPRVDAAQEAKIQQRLAALMDDNVEHREWPVLVDDPNDNEDNEDDEAEDNDAEGGNGRRLLAGSSAGAGPSHAQKQRYKEICTETEYLNTCLETSGSSRDVIGTAASDSAGVGVGVLV